MTQRMDTLQETIANVIDTKQEQAKKEILKKMQTLAVSHLTLAMADLMSIAGSHKRAFKSAAAN